MIGDKLGYKFWYIHRNILSRCGVECEDVLQQTALIRMKGNGYVWERLIDWVRHMTDYDPATKTHPVLIEYQEWHSPPFHMEHRVRDFLIWLHHTPLPDTRWITIVHRLLEGYTKKEIAGQLQCTPMRVTQLFQELGKFYTSKEKEKS